MFFNRADDADGADRENVGIFGGDVGALKIPTCGSLGMVLDWILPLTREPEHLRATYQHPLAQWDSALCYLLSIWGKYTKEKPNHQIREFGGISYIGLIL